MYWTLELASSLDDAPWPASKDELIDYANRSGAPEEVIENLQELEDDGEIYETIDHIDPETNQPVFREEPEEKPTRKKEREPEKKTEKKK